MNTEPSLIVSVSIFSTLGRRFLLGNNWFSFFVTVLCFIVEGTYERG